MVKLEDVVDSLKAMIHEYQQVSSDNENFELCHAQDLVDYYESDKRLGYAYTKPPNKAS